VQAQEGRVGDLDQRIVDLEVEDRADAAPAHLVEATRRAVGAGGCQRLERPAVAVGAERQVALLSEEDPRRFAVDGGHLPLDEEADVLEAELPVLGEEARGGLVILGARHHVQGGRLAVSPADGHDLLGVDLEEAGGGDRPDRVRPLGAVEAEAGAETPRDDHDRDLAGRQGRRADRRGVPSSDAFAVRRGRRKTSTGRTRSGAGTSDPSARLGSRSGRRAPRSRSPRSRRPARPAVRIELVPPPEQVPLSMPFQARNQRRVRRHSHPLLS
jgi:hypothetical protein